MKLRFRSLLSLLVLFFLCTTISAQDKLENNIKSNDLLRTYFKNYKIVKLDAKEIYSAVKSRAFNNEVTLNMGEDINLEIYPSHILSKDYVLTTPQSDRGSKSIEKSILPFKGYVSGDNSSDVRMTFGEDFVYGYIFQGASKRFIEPLNYFDKNAADDLYVVYDVVDVIYQGGTCAATTMHKKSHELHTNNQNRLLVGLCYEVEIAIASDFSMFQAFGGIAGVEARNIGVMNNVQGNYDDEFADELQFVIVEQWISDCNSCDPWTSSTNAGTLLNSFTNWGPSGFSTTHDVGSLWTDRNLQGSTIGIAWVGAVCTGNRYNVLENFTSTAWGLRVLTSHELGHNFDAVHDASGSGFIMAPAVNNTNTWSSNSINDIENYYANANCLAFCPPVGVPPVSEFEADNTTACRFTTVNFTDLSENTPTSWFWTFEGGTPATSTEENPSVVWNTPGTYNVTLQATNSSGSDTNTKTDYMTIEDTPIPGFNYNINQSFVTFINTSISGTSFFWEFGDGDVSTDFEPTHIYEDGVYNVTLSASNSCGTQAYSQTITIVTLPMANFTQDITEGCIPFDVQFQNLSSSNTTSFVWTFEGGTPATSTEENPLVTYENEGIFSVTLRAITGAGFDEETHTNIIIAKDIPTANFGYLANGNDFSFNNQSTNADSYSWDFGDSASSTDENPMHTYAGDGTYDVVLTATNDCGSEDFSLTIVISNLPQSNFAANATSGCSGISIDFQDASTNADTWAWTFEGGTPATSSEQNPTITYNNDGLFDVSLIVSNSEGNDTTIMSDYILIDAYPVATYTYVSNGNTVSFNNSSTNANTYNWFFDTDNTSSEEDPTFTFNNDGIYPVMLISTNDCGSDTITQDVEIITPPTSGFTLSNSGMGCLPFEVTFNNTSSANATNYAWTFEGGMPASSTEQNPTVIYNAPGIFDVQLIVSNDLASDTTILLDNIVVGDIPDAGFSFDINELNVNFMNSTTNGDTYYWDSGDQATSTDENFTHTYSQEGMYTVMLIATNDCGMDTIIQDINVSSLPTAQFQSSSQSDCLPSLVQYTDDSANGATSWSWTFEGATPETSTDQNPIVTYNNSGTFDVQLIATNNAGSDTTTFTDYFMAYPSPDAQFIGLADALNVQFNNTSTGAVSYEWQFGNDSTSTMENPMMAYQTEGDYDVLLIATSQEGCIDSMIQTITLMTSDIRQIDNENALFIFPNPNNGQFTIDINGQYNGDVQVEIFDIVGHAFGVQNYQKTSSILSIPMALDQFSQGTYIVKVALGNAVIYEKVIIH